jgi:dihydrodipicolinate synthase/N-acetylneuraminate lyase
LAELQVPAVLIAASTGQGHLRSMQELEEWFESAASSSLGNTLPIALLRPEDGRAANERLVARLADLGYVVVFVRPGTDLPPDALPQAVADNMQPLVETSAASGLAVGVYSISDVSGVALTPESVVRLVEGPGGDRIVAVKVTEAAYESSTLRFLQQPSLRGLKIVQGWDPHLARALRDGPQFDDLGRQRCGVTSGPMSLAVHQYLHILRAAEQGDWGEVEAAQRAVTVLFASMQDDPTRFADLQRAKVIMGLGQPLTGEITHDHVQRVISALRSLPRDDDRARLARSLDLMGDGPYHETLAAMY